MGSAWEDRAPWLGDHDLSAPQTVQPSTVEQRCVGSDGPRLIGAPQTPSSVLFHQLIRISVAFSHRLSCTKCHHTVR